MQFPRCRKNYRVIQKNYRDRDSKRCALILFKISSLYKSFTYLLTYISWGSVAFCYKFTAAYQLKELWQELSSCWSGRPCRSVGRKVGEGCCAPFRGGVGFAVALSKGAGSPSNTMWPGPRPTSIPSGIFIHPTVWPQYTNVTDMQIGHNGLIA